MCGRFASNLTWQELHELYEIAAPERTPAPPDLQPHYNVAPTQTVPVVRLNGAPADASSPSCVGA
jgi:putative SOS response-associated peptidase YedK